MLFCDYYKEWLKLYKEGSVKPVTLKKYNSTLYWLNELIPKVKIKKLDRAEYQKMINLYAETHEKQTTVDFHTQVKACIEDAIDEGLIKKDPTKKVILKGKLPKVKKEKYLNLSELKKLIGNLNLGDKINYDWLIYLIAKTGMRFAEAVAITPEDFNFKKSTININKTWNYKEGGGFDTTKNASSFRVISIDRKTRDQFKILCKGLDPKKPIFIISKTGNIFNSTINDLLERHCKKVGITTISCHGLRHTYGSICLYNGISIQSISRQLGHSSIATTQKVYLHIILELENKDKNKMMRSFEQI